MTRPREVAKAVGAVLVVEPFRKQPLNSAIALVLTLFGIVTLFLPTTPGPEETISKIGSISLALGTLMFSNVIAGIGRMEDAVEVLEPVLSPLAGRLTTVSGQMRQIVTRLGSAQLDEGTATELLSQVNNTLIGIINDLRLLGLAKVDFQQILDLIDQIAKFGVDLDGTRALPRLEDSAGAQSPTGGPNWRHQVGPPETSTSTVSGEASEGSREGTEVQGPGGAAGAGGGVAAELPSLLLQLKSALKDAGLRPESPKRLENIDCPACGGRQQVPVGKAAGDTTNATCAVCGDRFAVHRAADGSVFTPRRRIEYDVTCPACEKFTFHIRHWPDREVRPRWCLECFAKVLPSADGGRTMAASAAPLEANEKYMNLEGKSTLECPNCQNAADAFVNYKGRVYAECHKCDRLLVRKEQADQLTPTLQAG